MGPSANFYLINLAEKTGRGGHCLSRTQVIILDNVGLYNYFGLPDANRHWRYHFIGHETPDEIPERNSDLLNVDRDEVLRERQYNEGDEDMLVVRGSAPTEDPVTCVHEDETAVDHSWDVTEFTLCDYYLVRGCEHKFQVYPLVKNRGKLTGGVTNAFYQYDDSVRPIRLGTKTQDNLLNILSSIKAQTVVMFSASMCEMTLRDVADVKKLAIRANTSVPYHITLWWMLQMIDKVWKEK